MTSSLMEVKLVCFSDSLESSRGTNVFSSLFASFILHAFWRLQDSVSRILVSEIPDFRFSTRLPSFSLLLVPAFDCSRCKQVLPTCFRICQTCLSL